MFKETFMGDYIWEVTPNITLRYMSNNYLDVYEGDPTTIVFIDDVSYPLKTDLRSEFEKTGGDLEKIKQVYIDNIELSDTPIPPNESYAPLLKVFVDHINQYIR